MRFYSILCLACLCNPNGCKHRVSEPWIPTEEELALEPHTDAGDATSSSEARPNGGATAG